MNLFDVYPINNINIKKASGSFVWDAHGNEYLDMYGGHAVISIGHTHPHWVNRITEQLNQIAFYSNSVQIEIQQELAKRLGEVSGKNNYQLFLVNSGAEANENALKLSSFHTGRKKIVAFNKSFHGRTSLAVAATDNPKIIAPVNETGNIDFLPFNDEDALQEYFNKNGHHVAAVIIETIQGVGGINIATDSFLQLTRRLCTEKGALLIADEIQCGYGRSGKFFAIDKAEIEADIYTMAKGMGNGFPVGGLLISPIIKPEYGMLGTTFGGNHLACAAALAVLEVMAHEDLINETDKNGNYLLYQLQSIDKIRNVRGLGLMIGFDVPDNMNQLRNILLQEYKIFTGEAKPNIIRILPALSVQREEMDLFLSSLKKALQDLS